MRVSGFTFLRNGKKLGYPFERSIRSILPVVDEFVVALGPSTDGTREQLLAMEEPKLRIVDTEWNPEVRNDYSIRGFTYGQQKSIALFNCTGEWAFYLEGDEVVHEEDLPAILASMERYRNDDRVEALVFDYLHFYGNIRTLAWSPRWYRRAPRIIKATIPAWAPKGLFFVVLDDHKKGRYPRAAHSGGRIFHYGHGRSEDEYRAKEESTELYWRNDKSRRTPRTIRYDRIDPATLRAYDGTHPAAIEGFFPTPDGLFRAAPDYRISRRERRHRLTLWLEKRLGFEVNHNHFRWAPGAPRRRESAADAPVDPTVPVSG